MRSKFFDEYKKQILLVLGVSIVILTTILIITSKKEIEEKNALRFSVEYPQVELDNIYVYRSYDEIIKILENGTGVILFGFPECPWCQRYAVYLNDVAKSLGYEKIYYYNILKDRQNNTEKYKNIVSYIESYLQYDEEGNKKIYVPAIVAINKGEIVGFDDETSYDTKGFETPEEYWTDDAVEALKTKLEAILTKSHPNMCSSCNEE